MEIKKFDDVKKYSGYIGINSCIKNDSNTVTSDIFYTELARVSKAIYLNNDNIPCYQLIHLGGAFLSGEKYLTDVNVDSNTHIILTSQAATKVNRTKTEDEPTSYDLNVELKENATLEFINDSIILYPQSRYEQRNNFYLEDSSTLIYNDIISPGYSGESHEKYLYDELFLLTKIYRNNTLILYDKLYYNPKIQNPNNYGIMNGYERCGNFLFISPHVNHNTSQEIIDLINSHKFGYNFEFGVSEFEVNALGIRVLANETFEILKIFQLIHNYIRSKYFGLDSLNLRKEHV